MDLPIGKGSGKLNIKVDKNVPNTEVRMYSGNGTYLGKIENIKCPVVENYNRSKGKDRTVERTAPDSSITNIKYNPNVKLKDADRQYVLLALEHFEGSISEASRALGISKNTIYRYLGKFYGKQYETK